MDADHPGNGVLIARRSTDPRHFSREEQAAALRNLADRVEKADERAGVIERSKQRVAERRGVMHFFGGRAVPPESLTDEQRRAAQEAQEAQLSAKAQDVQPMRHFATDWTQRAAELRAANPQQPDAPTPTRGPRMKP